MAETDLLYEKIADYLRDRIYSGDLKVGERLPTEMELAKQFQVSRITSKRAVEELKNSGLVYSVRGSGTYVAEAPQELEKSSIDRPSLYRQVVSLVIPFKESAGGIMDTIIGVSDVLKPAGYMVDVNCLTAQNNSPRKCLMDLYERGTGGIIYYPSSDREIVELMNLFYLEKYPFVLIDKYYDSIPLCSVVSDNRKGMYEMTKYLLEMGHRKIAFFANKSMENASSIRDRYLGYASALNEYGITVSPRYVINEPLSATDAQTYKQHIRSLMQQGITAICAVNDEVAITLIHYLRQLGVSVPDEMSVTGFDDIRLKNLLDRPLTTVRQDMYQIGNTAGTLMLEMLRNGTPASPHRVIPTQLMARETAAAPTSAGSKE